MANEIAKAYIQLVPTAQGIKGSIAKELSGEVDKAGDEGGQSFASKLKSAVIAAGIGAAVMKGIKASLDEGAALEQSIGGIETLFKDSSDKIIEYANEAWKTSGLSANEYMETATSFSASLLQGLGGDTEKAAEITDMAIRDMSDNANKMGTDMESIQNAYQGFAKQNYTMLDNLKLGYGGTKSEMERLLKDAEKVTGVHYDINNLNDVYEAIHVIQGELDITGTTSKEAASTLSGSAAAMKSAWKNLLGEMSLGGDLEEPLKALIESAATFLFNNLVPMIGNIVLSIPKIIGDFLSNGLDVGDTSKWEKLNDWLDNSLRPFMDHAWSKGSEFVTNLLNGLWEKLPELFDSMGEKMSDLVTTVGEKAPEFMTAAGKWIGGLVQGFLSNLPNLITHAIQGIIKLVGSLLKQLPNFISAGIEFIKSVGQGLIDGLVDVIKGIPELCQQIWDAFMDIDWVELGKNIIYGIGEGLLSLGEWLWDGACDIGQGLVDGFCDFFGINSPSRLTRDLIGKNLMYGISEGLEDAKDDVYGTLDNVSGAISDTLNTSYNLENMDSYRTNENEDIVSLLNQLVDKTEKEYRFVVNGREFALATAQDINDSLGMLQRRENRL